METTLRLSGSMNGKRMSKFPSEALVESERYGLKLKPNFSGDVVRDEFNIKFRINSLGFRGEEIGAKSGYRIVCLGDSMTFGYGVNDDETFTKILGDRLNKETINIGVLGYDIDRYFLLFEDVVLPLKPDLLIVFFAVTNDFGQSVKKGSAPAIKIESGPSFVSHIKNVKEHIFLNSHLCRWFKSRLDTTSKLNMLLIRLGLRSAGEIYLRKYPKTMLAKVKRVRLILKDISVRSKEQGFELVVVAIPDLAQVADGVRLDPEIWDLDKPNRVLSSIAGELNLRYLDLLPFFKQSREMFYYPIDGHLNRAGHKKAADCVYEYIQKGPES
ncbi:SGNH/GDSL hydrolase family protein [Candidatus Omnitrophota bacterium]